MRDHTTFILLSLLASSEGIFARPHDHLPAHRHHVRNGLIFPRADGNGTSSNNTQVPVPVPPPATSRKASSSLYSASHTPSASGSGTSSAPLSSRPPASQTASSAPAATTSVAPKTVSNGEVLKDLAIGTVVAAGVGGGFLLLAGTYFSMAAGSVATVTGAAGGALGGLGSGLSSISGPEPQQVDSPEDPPDNGDQNQVTPTIAPTEAPTSLDLDLLPSATSSFPFSYTLTSSQASATPSGGPRYIIVPDSKGSATDFDSVESSLSGSAGSSLVSVEDEEDKSTLFLTAPLSPQQVKDLETKPGVGAVSQDVVLGDMDKMVAEETYNPADAAGPSVPPPALTKDPLALAKQPQKVVRQEGYDVESMIPQKPSHEDAGELATLSQAPGKPRGSSFAYDEVAGQGITVYILGTGMNLNSPDIRDAVGTKDFIYAPGAAETKTDDDPLIGYPDGTCMASKIFGPKYGVAKKANVVMVKLSGESGMMGSITLAEMLTALAMVKNDVNARKLKGKAVVNLSYTTPMSDPEAIAAYKEILVKMMDDDIVLVAPTGVVRNNNGSTANDQYPAAFAKDTALIAVNGVNGKGQHMDWTPGTVEDGVTAAAPVTGRCAYKNVDPKVRGGVTKDQNLSRLYYSEGMAAATVAGVAAGLMAQAEYQTQLQVPGKVAANVKELVAGLAWVRAEGAPPVVWNGVTPYGGVCRRQEGDSCSAAPSATPTAAATAAPTAAPSAPAKPPKPTYNVPGTWKKQYEGDVNYSFDYTSSSNTASDGYTGDDPLSWCLDKCTNACVSVFLTRVNQKQTDGYNTYFICNQYDKVWSNDFLQKLSSSDYDAGIALDKL